VVRLVRSGGGNKKGDGGLLPPAYKLFGSRVEGSKDLGLRFETAAQGWLRTWGTLQKGGGGSGAERNETELKRGGLLRLTGKGIERLGLEGGQLGW